MKKTLLASLLLIPGSMFGMLRKTARLRTALKRVVPKMRRLRRSVPIVHKRKFSDQQRNFVLPSNPDERRKIIAQTVQVRNKLIGLEDRNRYVKDLESCRKCISIGVVLVPLWPICAFMGVFSGFMFGGSAVGLLNLVEGVKAFKALPPAKVRKELENDIKKYRSQVASVIPQLTREEKEEYLGWDYGFDW